MVLPQVLGDHRFRSQTVPVGFPLCDEFRSTWDVFHGLLDDLLMMSRIYFDSALLREIEVIELVHFLSVSRNYCSEDVLANDSIKSA